MVEMAGFLEQATCVLNESYLGCCNESATVCKGNETPLSVTAETSLSLEGRFTIGYHVLGDDLNQWIWFSHRVQSKTWVISTEG